MWGARDEKLKVVPAEIRVLTRVTVTVATGRPMVWRIHLNQPQRPCEVGEPGGWRAI